MEIYQIIVPLIGLASVGMSVRQYILGRNTIFESGFWMVFWFFVSLVALFPDPITYIYIKNDWY